jgi:hypothetical protein
MSFGEGLGITGITACPTPQATTFELPRSFNLPEVAYFQQAPPTLTYFLYLIEIIRPDPFRSVFPKNASIAFPSYRRHHHVYRAV